MDEASTDVVVVTGASRGIGRLLALHLAATGRRVGAIARPSAELDSLADDTGGIHAVPADVTDPAELRDAFEAVTARLGRPSAVIAAAGSADGIGPVAGVDPERWWSAVTVDLRGTMLTAQVALQTMLRERHGRILTVYGNLGDRGTPNVSAFAAAKAAVARFTESLAAEISGTGVVALCVHPGFVRTPMTELLAYGEDGRTWLPEFGARAERHWGDGHEAAALVDQILTGAADGLTGRIVHVGDDLAALTRQATGGADLRRLRVTETRG